MEPDLKNQRARLIVEAMLTAQSMSRAVSACASTGCAGSGGQERRPRALGNPLGDISAHFNPAMTLAFALRGDMGWVMTGVSWAVQFGAADLGSLLARAFFGVPGNLAATMPPPGRSWQAAGFEAILTFGLVLMVLNLADGPKLNGPLVSCA